MLGPDELYFFDERLVPGRTKFDDVFMDFPQITPFDRRDTYSIWEVRFLEGECSIGTVPIACVALNFLGDTLVAMNGPFPAESLETVTRYFQERFGGESSTDWTNGQSEAHLFQRRGMRSWTHKIIHIELQKQFKAAVTAANTDEQP